DLKQTVAWRERQRVEHEISLGYLCVLERLGSPAEIAARIKAVLGQPLGKEIVPQVIVLRDILPAPAPRFTSHPMVQAVGEARFEQAFAGVLQLAPIAQEKSE